MARRTGVPADGAPRAIARPTPGSDSALRAGPVTVAELEQIPGAREALVRYILLLQEWAEQSEKGASSLERQRDDT